MPSVWDQSDQKKRRDPAINGLWYRRVDETLPRMIAISAAVGTAVGTGLHKDNLASLGPHKDDLAFLSPDIVIGIWCKVVDDDRLPVCHVVG